MKANEAPEKLYIDLFKGEFNVSYSPINNSVEYIRTDAFIEKALKWYCLDCECNNNCNADHKCFFRQEYKRYLEGNENACLPKFAGAILNPDGSTSENWRHRHFIRKMQDAFMKKAENFLEMLGYGFTITDNITNANYDKEQLIDDFRKYIK